MRANHPATFRPLDRGGNDIAPRQHAESRMHLVVSLQRCRHTNRLVTDVVHLSLQYEAKSIAGFALDQMLPHIRACGRRRRGVKVEIFVKVLRWEIDSCASKPARRRLGKAVSFRARSWLSPSACCAPMT